MHDRDATSTAATLWREAVQRAMALWAGVSIPARLRETARGADIALWSARVIALLYFAAILRWTRSELDLGSLRLGRWVVLAYWAHTITSGGLLARRRLVFLPAWIGTVEAAIEIVLISALVYATRQISSDIGLAYALPMLTAYRYAARHHRVPLMLWLALSLGVAELAGGSIRAEAPALITSLLQVALLMLGGYWLMYRRMTPPLADDDNVSVVEEFRTSSIGSLQAGFFVVDRRGHVLYANEALERRLGPPRAHEAAAEYFFRGQRNGHRWFASPFDGDPIRMDLTDIGGNRFTADVSLSPIMGAGAEPNYFVGVLHDVTRHEWATAQLGATLREYRVSVSALADQRKSWLEMFENVSRRLTSIDDPSEMLRYVAKETCNRLHAETAAVFALEGDVLVRRSIAPFADTWFVDEHYRRGVGLTGQVIVAPEGALHGRRFVSNAVDIEPMVVKGHLRRYVRKLPSGCVKHLVAVPLNAHFGTFGVLRIVNKMANGNLDPTGFTHEDVQTLETMAAMVSIALQQSRTREKLEARVRDLKQLHTASLDLLATQDKGAILDHLFEVAATVLHSDHTSILLLDDDGKPVESDDKPHLGPRLHERLRSNGITRRVIDEGIMLAHDDITKAPSGTHNPFLTEHGFRAYVGIPLRSREKTLGVLFVHSRTPARFAGREELLQTFGNQAAVAFDNLHLHGRATGQAESLRKLEQVSQGLILHLKRDELYDYIVGETARAFDVEDCSLYTVDRGRNTVDLVASASIPREVWHKRDAHLDKGGLTAYSVREKVSLNLGAEDYRRHHAWSGHEGDPFVEHLNSLESKRCRSVVITPILNRNGHAVGAIKLENRRGPLEDAQFDRPFPEHQVSVVQSLAAQVATVLERTNLWESLDEHARRIFAFDVHLALGFLTSGVQANATRARHHLADDKRDLARESLTVIQRAAGNAYAILHPLLRVAVRPGAASDFVTMLRYSAKALQEDVESTKPIVTFGRIDRVDLSDEVTHLLWRIGATALHNAVSHANCDRPARVSLTQAGRVLQLAVRDYGPGFDVESALATGHAYGVESMYAWCEKIGASLSFDAMKPGTRIRVRLRLEDPHDHRSSG